MQILLETSPIEKLSADALAVVCYDDANPAIAEQAGWLGELRASQEFSGKLYETAMLHRPQGVAAKRLVVIGGGKREKFSTVEARRAAGALVRTLKNKGVRSIVLLVEQAELVEAITEGALLGSWKRTNTSQTPRKTSCRWRPSRWQCPAPSPTP